MNRLPRALAAGKDWEYGRNHGVIPGGNWGGSIKKSTFASITDGFAPTLMIGEKWLA